MKNTRLIHRYIIIYKYHQTPTRRKKGKNEEEEEEVRTEIHVIKFHVQVLKHLLKRRRIMKYSK